MRGLLLPIAAAMLFAVAAGPAWANPLPDDACTGPGITRPGLAGPHSVPPDQYPLVSLIQHEEGKVTLGFTIKDDGSITDIHVVTSSGYPRLDDAAVQGVVSWRYTPGTKDGKPIACPWRAVVNWMMQNAPSIFPQNGPYGVVNLGPADYPSAALRKRESGAAAFMVAVDPKGKMLFWLMVRGTGSTDLDSASLDYIKERMNVKPAEIAGKPVETVVNVVLFWSPDPPAQAGAEPPAAAPKQ